MYDFLIYLFTLSVGGGLIGLVLMGLARLTRSRYGARWRCVVWALLCLRMVLPVPPLPSIPAPIQLTAPDLGSAAVETWTPTVTSGVEVTPSPVSEQGPSGSPKMGLTLSQELTAVWVLGAVGVFMWSVLAHLRLRRYLRRWAAPVVCENICGRYLALAERLKLKRAPRLLACPGLEVPMLAGVINPVLLLPPDVEEDEMLEYALLHELIHHRRRDIWLKVLAVLALCVHWFNPLVWWMVRQVEGDMELACDESVLQVLPPEKYRAYGETVLRAAARGKT